MLYSIIAEKSDLEKVKFELLKIDFLKFKIWYFKCDNFYFLQNFIFDKFRYQQFHSIKNYMLSKKYLFQKNG